MGAKEGAWCAIDTVRRPILRVNGLENGKVHFEVLREDRHMYRCSMEADGDFELWHLAPNLFWIRVSATDPTSDLVCLVIPKPKAA